jgi:hypothetical protein
MGGRVESAEGEIGLVKGESRARERERVSVSWKGNVRCRCNEGYGARKSEWVMGAW